MAKFEIHDEQLTGLKGKIVIVTGGSGGIGLATVQLLSSLGAFVVNGDIAPPPEANIPNVTFVKTSVASWPELLHLFKETKKQHGRVDHVFANAGVGPRADYFSMDLDENGDLKEPTSDLMDINLKGVMNTVTLAIYYMRQQPDGGSVVVNASTMAFQPCRSIDYATAKHGVLGFARGLPPRIETLKLPIRVNSLAPSWASTSVVADMEEILATLNVEIQSPQVVARAAVLLMADASRNAEVIHVQCGKYQEIDQALLLPMADTIRGPDYPAEDLVLKQTLEILAARGHGL